MSRSTIYTRLMAFYLIVGGLLVPAAYAGKPHFKQIGLAILNYSNDSIETPDDLFGRDPEAPLPVDDPEAPLRESRRYYEYDFAELELLAEELELEGEELLWFYELFLSDEGDILP